MSQLLQAAIRSGAVSADGTTAPDSFSQGIPFAAGAIAIDGTSAIASYSQGLPMTAAGRIATTTDAPASWVSGTMPINAAGRLCMLSGAVDSYVTGIPFTATGQVAVASSAESRFTLNGTTQWITFSPWTPTSVNYAVEAYSTPNTTAGTVYIVSAATNPQTALYSADAANYIARMELAAGGSAFPNSGVLKVIGETVKSTLVVTPTTYDYDVTGNDTAPSSTATVFNNPITNIGGYSAGTAWSGVIYDVKLIDADTPSNSRWYKINDGAGATIKCYEENGDLKPDNTLDGTIAGFVDNSAWS